MSSLAGDLTIAVIVLSVADMAASIESAAHPVTPSWRDRGRAPRAAGRTA